jgi:hypothetical protein
MFFGDSRFQTETFFIELGTIPSRFLARNWKHVGEYIYYWATTLDGRAKIKFDDGI